MYSEFLKQQLIETGYALIVTYSLGRWAIHYAYLERGYIATGGEYLFILWVYILSYKVMEFYLKNRGDDS